MVTKPGVGSVGQPCRLLRHSAGGGDADSTTAG
jgi:hypothetical protein